jgi:LuxR family maltose regulon positive regulatory protein
VRRTLEKEGVGLELHQWLPDLARLLQGPDPDKIAELSAQASLSDRELDVLRQMAMGFSNQEIADQLYISLHTVKTHARKINVKLGAKSRTQAIHRAKELMLL